MALKAEKWSSCARQALAAVRIFNGSLGLLAPEVLIKRIDPQHQPSPAAIYAFRLFGIRTILIGADLLVLRGASLRRALYQGVLVHGSDTMTSVLLGLQSKTTPRTATMLAAISAGNVLLALLSLRSGGHEGDGHGHDFGGQRPAVADSNAPGQRRFVGRFVGSTRQ